MTDLKKIKSLFAPVFLAALFLVMFTPVSYSGAAEPVELEEGVILLATEKVGGIFNKSVILIFKHLPDKGTLGLIVNKPSGHLLSSLIDVKGELENLHKDLFFGGPVNPKIPTLLLNTEIPPQGADELFDGVYFSGSAIKVLNDEALNGIIHNEIRTYSGVSSWARGQLEAEINRGSWILLKPDVETVFSMEPERLWEDLQEKLKRKGLQLIEVKNMHSTQPRRSQDSK